MTRLGGCLKTISLYLAVALLSLVLLVWVLKLWQFDIRMPLNYVRDSVPMLALVKGIVDNGWIFHNNYVGMPTGLHSFPFDYPQLLVNSLHLIIMKFLTFFSRDHCVIVNSYYFLTFPLVSCASLFVFRQIGLSYCTAIAGALLYTFVPYHLTRSTIHLFLSGYYVVPLSTMVALWIYREETPIIKYNPENGLTANFAGSKTVASLLLSVVISISGEYYVSLGCFFIIVSGVLASTVARRFDQLLTALAVVAFIAVIFVASLAPSFVYSMRYGRNPATVARTPGDSEYYGMKIRNLVLPLDDHRIAFLARLKNQCNYAPPSPVPNWEREPIGMVGAFGFFVLTWWLLFRRGEGGSSGSFGQVKSFLATLNGAGVLLATVGGFAYLFACLVTPLLRCLNRMSIFIAFFSICAAMIVLEECYARWGRAKLSKGFLRVFTCGLVGLGILDQTSASMIPSYDDVKKQYVMDRAFVSRIECDMPEDAMIFQLPFFKFPEGGSYSHFRAYLHSRRLRWSFGAMDGREGDLWQRQVTSKPLNEMARDMVAAGFSGIYLDRELCGDRAADLEAKLSALLRVEPLIAPDNKKVFFDLRNYGLVKQGQVIDFASFEAEPLLGPGWSGREDWGRWTDGSPAVISFRLKAFDPVSYYAMKLRGVLFPEPDQVISVSLNGERIGEIDSRSIKTEMCSVAFPGKMLRLNNQIVFDIARAQSPKELGRSEDSRKLGLGVKTFSIIPRE